MTAKVYLNQAWYLYALINCPCVRLTTGRFYRAVSQARDLIECHTVPPRPTETPFVRCLEKIDEIQRSVEKKIILRDEINARKDMLDNHEEQVLLRYRYIDGFTWEEIESMMNVSERTEFRIYGNALAHFSVPY